MKKKKIAMFPGIFLAGGVESVVMNIYNNADKEKYAFDFFVPRNYPGPFDDIIKEDGNKVIYIPEIKKTSIFKYILIIKRKLKENGCYDIIHVHSIHSGVFISIAGFLSKIKRRIYHVHNTADPSISRMKLSRFYRFFARVMIGFTNNKHIACGNEAARYIYSKRKFKNGGVYIFKNAINLNVFYPFNSSKYIRKFDSITKDTKFLGNAARFTSIKNQKFLIELMSIFNEDEDYRLILAGDGEQLEENKLLAKQLNVYHKILFLGNIDDMATFYNNLNVFLLPSLHEGLPVSIIEAQACGIPSILSDSITDEVDMKIGLVEFLSLNQPLLDWKNKILELSNKKTYDKEYIEKCLTRNGYNLSQIDVLIDKMYM